MSGYTEKLQDAPFPAWELLVQGKTSFAFLQILQLVEHHASHN